MPVRGRNSDSQVKLIEKRDARLREFPDPMLGDLRKVSGEVPEEEAKKDKMSAKVHEAFQKFKPSLDSVQYLLKSRSISHACKYRITSEVCARPYTLDQLPDSDSATPAPRFPKDSTCRQGCISVWGRPARLPRLAFATQAPRRSSRKSKGKAVWREECRGTRMLPQPVVENLQCILHVAALQFHHR